MVKRAIVLEYELSPKGRETKFINLETLEDFGSENIEIKVHEKTEERIKGTIILTGGLYDKYKKDLIGARDIIKVSLETLIDGINVKIGNVIIYKDGRKGQLKTTTLETEMRVCVRERKLHTSKILRSFFSHFSKDFDRLFDIINILSLLKSLIKQHRYTLYIIFDILYAMLELQKYTGLDNYNPKKDEIREEEVQEFKEAYDYFEKITGIPMYSILDEKKYMITDEEGYRKIYRKKYSWFLKKMWKLLEILHLELEPKERLYLILLRPLRNAIAHLDSKSSDIQFYEKRKKLEGFIIPKVSIYANIIQKITLRIMDLEQYYEEGDKIYKPEDQ